MSGTSFVRLRAGCMSYPWIQSKAGECATLNETHDYNRAGQRLMAGSQHGSFAFRSSELTPSREGLKMRSLVAFRRNKTGYSAVW